MLRFECWQFWTVFWLYLYRKYTTFKAGFFLGWLNLQLRWYLLTAEIKLILINDEAYSLPFSNQSNLLRFECCQFWTVFWLYLIFHIFFFLTFFPILNSNCATVLWKKKCLKNFENLDIVKFTAFFWKIHTFWRLFASFSFYTCACFLKFVSKSNGL